jgi:hypothetical protein
MSNTFEDNIKPITVTAGAAISQGQLLTLSGATASVAGLTSEADAVALQDIVSGELGTAKRLSTGDTYEVLADGDGHSVADPLFGAASGVASDTQGTGAFRVGIAVTAAGADELFEMQYKPAFTAGS